MRGLILGDKAKPPLVLCHGFGSSGACHFWAFKHLCQYFTVYTIDWIGMGSSDRPSNFKFDCTPTQAKDYVVDHFETWRKAMALKDFYLVGHSFGGYNVGHYAVKYPRHIKKIVFLSPIGIGYHTEDELKVYNDSDKLKHGEK